MEWSNITDETNQRIDEEKLAELMLMPEKNILGKHCPFRGLIERSFIERALWLQARTRSQLYAMIMQCEACAQCPHTNPRIALKK
ncbi:MAG: hypothetical protein LBB11_01420 [Puniceicoccales bacterium]|nr:hypothetical protein [Puniceicoccales bacterium]